MRTTHKVSIVSAVVLTLAAGGAGVEGFIPHWEGTKHVISHNSFDPPKIKDVCQGHVVNMAKPDIPIREYYTDAMCADILAMDIPRYNKMLVRIFGKNFEVTNHQHVALLSFVYNLGEGTVSRSSAAKLLKEGKIEQGCDAMGNYTRAAGKFLPGLEHRRYDDFWGEIAWCKRDD